MNTFLHLQVIHCADLSLCACFACCQDFWQKLLSSKDSYVKAELHGVVASGLRTYQ